MRVRTRFLVSVLLLAGCGHGTSSLHGPPDDARDEGVRIKGGSTATSRVPILLARGEYAEAEVLIVELAKAGQLSREEAERLQREARRLKEQRTDSGRKPPPVEPWGPTEDEPPEEERQTCGTTLPTHPLCSELPGEYAFASSNAALEGMKQRLGEQRLKKHHPDVATKGPCPGIGAHYNVRLNGERMGSIACCPCCVDTANGPIKWEKCRIVW